MTDMHLGAPPARVVGSAVVGLIGGLVLGTILTGTLVQGIGWGIVSAAGLAVLSLLVSSEYTGKVIVGAIVGLVGGFVVFWVVIGSFEFAIFGGVGGAVASAIQAMITFEPDDV
jgi:hypothetical protein